MKRNLFSRIVAGIGAFALVAGMMPAMTAQAAFEADHPIKLSALSSPGVTVTLRQTNTTGDETVTGEVTKDNASGYLTNGRAFSLEVSLKEGYAVSGTPTIHVVSAATDPTTAPTTGVGSIVGGTDDDGPWTYRVTTTATVEGPVWVYVGGVTAVTKAIVNGSATKDGVTVNFSPDGGAGFAASAAPKYITSPIPTTGLNGTDFAKGVTAAVPGVSPAVINFQNGHVNPLVKQDIRITSTEVTATSGKVIDKVVLELITNDADIEQALSNGVDAPDPVYGEPIELEKSTDRASNLTAGFFYTIKKGTLTNDARITVTLTDAKTHTVTINADEGILLSTNASSLNAAEDSYDVESGTTLVNGVYNTYKDSNNAWTIDGLFAIISDELNPNKANPVYEIDLDKSTYQIGEKEAVEGGVAVALPDAKSTQLKVNKPAIGQDGDASVASLLTFDTTTPFAITGSVLTERITADTVINLKLKFVNPKNIRFQQDGNATPTDVSVRDTEDKNIAAGVQYTNPNEEFKFKVESRKKGQKIMKVSYSIGTKGAVEIKADGDGVYTIPAKTIDQDTIVNISTSETHKVTVVEGTLEDTSTDLYAVGEKVGIKATVPNGKAFDKWTSEQDVIFEDATAETTRFTMTDEDITVTATFKDAEKKNFVDVVRPSWYADAVDWAVENGVTSGIDETHFGVGQDLTRAQAAVFLAAYAKATLSDPTEKPFPDVELGQWFTKQMAWAKAQKVMSGYDNGNGGPNDGVTRIQAALMMRMLADPEGTGDKSFPDVTAAWMLPGSQWAGTNGIIAGDTNGNFNPNDVCKREQFVVMMKALNEKFPPKADENKADENKADENKAEENKTDENKTDENKTGDESKEGETTTP